MVEGVVGRPTNVGGRRWLCATDVWSVTLLAAGADGMSLLGGIDLEALGNDGTFSAYVNGELFNAFEGILGRRLCTPVGVWALMPRDVRGLATSVLFLLPSRSRRPSALVIGVNGLESWIRRALLRLGGRL